jgi:hypothetical protein
LTRKEKPTHEKTQKCKKAYSSRMITLAKKTKVNSDILIVLDDMLDTRRPYIMVHTDGDIKTEKRRLFTTESKLKREDYSLRRIIIVMIRKMP